MAIRRILIFAPLVLIVFLLQSYFWVPSYEQQARGNPDRLGDYITASIGDASLLNPILSTDTASSTIESMVFEGLIDRDEELRFRGRLATGWAVSEEAFFYVNAAARLPGGQPPDPDSVLRLLEEARRNRDRLPPKVAASLGAITDLSLLPPTRFETRRPSVNPGADPKAAPVDIEVSAPARIRLALDRVDQDLFYHLGDLLGKDYFSSFDALPFLHPKSPIAADRLKQLAQELLPAVEHNPIVVFSLRPGVKFHDGRPFSAADVKFTYEAIMDRQSLSPRSADFEPVKTVEIVDPLTIKIVYKRLYSPAIGTWSMGILPAHLLNREAIRQEALRTGKDPAAFTIRQSEFNRRPVGCGPFKFREWKSDQYIRLDRFDDYWEGPPNYRTYTYRVIPDLLTQEMEFYAGTVDSYAVQPHQVKRLESDPRFQNFSGTSFGYTYIGYNLRRPPFDDVRVRKALGMAIDVDKIIRYVLYDQGERITGPFVKQTEYYNQRIPAAPFDPQGALALLAQAGWQKNSDGWLEKDGRKLQFTLITNSGNDLRKAVAAIAQDAWKQIGIDVRTDLLEWSVFIQERVHKLDFDAIILGWRMGIDPDLYQIWHSSQTNPNQLNFVGFKNPEADDLIVKIRQEYNFQKQVEFSHRLHEIIADEVPYSFLYVNKWTAVLDRRIVIKTVDADGRIRYRKITPTKTGDFDFYFKKWIKLPTVSTVALEG